MTATVIMESSGRQWDGDAFLAKLRADPMYHEFLGIVDDEAAWGRWLDRQPLGPPEPIIIIAQSLSITYRKGRNFAAARKWADVHLRLARSLPAGFGPSRSNIGYGRDRHVGSALCGVARLEQLQGSPERAHHLLREAERYFDIEERARTREGVTQRPAEERILGLGSARASLYEDLAESAARLGLMDQARHYFDLWQASRIQVPSSDDKISDLLQRAAIERNRGRLDDALSILRQAQDIVETENPDLTSMTRSACLVYQATARVYASVGTPRSALAMLEQAKQSVDDQAEPTLPASIELDIAHVLSNFPFLGDPLPHLLRALEYHSVPVDAEGERSWRRPDGTLMRVIALDPAWPVLLAIAKNLEERQRAAESAGFLRLAVSIAEQVRNGTLDEASRMAVQGQRSQAFIDLARVHLRLAEETGTGTTDRHTTAAWEAIEALRARTFLDTLGDVELPVPAGIPPGLATREEALLERRRGSRLSPVRDDAFWTEQERIDQELAAVWQDMRAASPQAAEYVAVREARSASPAEVAESLSAVAGTGAVGQIVVLNMFFADDEHLSFLASDAADGSLRTASSPVNRRSLARFVSSNFGEARRVHALAMDQEDLFHHVLSDVAGPIADLCEPGDTVVICPSAPLHHVPLGAVRVGADCDVLLARNPIAFAPSASVLRSLRLPERPGTAATHAIFGDPTGNLPRAREEAIALAGIWADAEPLLGPSATAGALLGALRFAQAVHVAAHADFNASAPLDSGVHMADRMVSAREILGVRATALDLVTLSACESGVYHADRAEDPTGLTRAVLFAGARSVLASLWRVADAPAECVMRGFYEHLAHGIPRGEALRRASLAAREEYPRLDAWAAFILTGAWT
jgi:CHAT domain-containing protein/tetratricopeptide (TPR) repeat protein